MLNILILNTVNSDNNNGLRRLKNFTILLEKSEECGHCLKVAPVVVEAFRRVP